MTWHGAVSVVPTVAYNSTTVYVCCIRMCHVVTRYTLVVLIRVASSVSCVSFVPRGLSYEMTVVCVLFDRRRRGRSGAPSHRPAQAARWTPVGLLWSVSGLWGVVSSSELWPAECPWRRGPLPVMGPRAHGPAAGRDSDQIDAARAVTAP